MIWLLSQNDPMSQFDKKGDWVKKMSKVDVSDVDKAVMVAIANFYIRNG